MKRNARKAFNELKKLGVPVSEIGYGHFVISAEDNVDEVWADFYDAMHIPGWEFGVNPKITTILNKYSLMDEWINPGILGVYDG